MPLDRPLKPGERIVINALPEGYIYHVETCDGRILTKDLKPRSFEETVALIQAGSCLV